MILFLQNWTDEGKVFQRIIERGIKLDRLDILLTAGTGYGSLRNWYPEVDDGEGIREDKYEGVRFSAFCKKVPKCESQTSSGEVADLSDSAGKTIREGESAWPLVLRSTQGKHTPWWAVPRQHKCGEVGGREMFFSTSVESRLFGRTFRTPCRCGCSRSECHWRLLPDVCEFSLVISECQP